MKFELDPPALLRRRGRAQQDEIDRHAALVERVGGDERRDHEHAGDAPVDGLPVEPPPPSRGRRRLLRGRRRRLARRCHGANTDCRHGSRVDGP